MQPVDDRTMLDDVMRLLLAYRGDDEVNLEIATEGHIVTMEWSMVRVTATSELEERLEELLGTAGEVSVEPVPS